MDPFVDAGHYDSDADRNGRRHRPDSNLPRETASATDADGNE